MATFGVEAFQGKDGRSLELRHCVEEDADAFLRFQPQIAAETTNTFQMPGRVPDREWIRELYRNAIRDEHELRLGVFDGSAMIGFLVFHLEFRPAHPWTQHVGYFGMMILQEFWGQGIGRALLNAMERHARSKGITRISAIVKTTNDHGMRLYTRAGYEIEGIRKRAARVDGVYVDQYSIAKLLD